MSRFGDIADEMHASGDITGAERVELLAHARDQDRMIGWRNLRGCVDWQAFYFDPVYHALIVRTRQMMHAYRGGVRGDTRRDFDRATYELQAALMGADGRTRERLADAMGDLRPLGEP